MAQQLEGQVELVVQGHAAHRLGQRGLLGDHLLHAGQAVPGLALRNYAAHVIFSPGPGDGLPHVLCGKVMATATAQDENPGVGDW
jgi:hypothetical protein